MWGWFYYSLIIFAANQGLATLAFFGVGVNLVLFLTRVLDQENAIAANNVSKWTGTVYLFSLVGAFLSDSYWGRFLTCAVFQIIFVVVIYMKYYLVNCYIKYLSSLLTQLFTNYIRAWGYYRSRHGYSWSNQRAVVMGNWLACPHPQLAWPFFTYPSI